MQVVIKAMIGFVIVWVAILAFMPKAELYYALEKKLEQQEIVLNEVSIDEGIFSLTISKITLFVKGIEVAKIEEVNLISFLFYTQITLKELLVDDALKDKIPSKTDTVTIMHNLLSPIDVFISASGSFGTVSGKMDVMERTTRIDFVEEKKIENIQSLLKRDEKGWYYETSF